jgi:hypothetical protein
MTDISGETVFKTARPVYYHGLFFVWKWRSACFGGNLKTLAKKERKDWHGFCICLIAVYF